MGSAVVNHPFIATVAINGTVLDIAAEEIHKVALPLYHRIEIKTLINVIIRRIYSYDPTLISLQDVVRQMHNIGALPVEMTTAIEVIKPSQAAGDQSQTIFFDFMRVFIIINTKYCRCL